VADNARSLQDVATLRSVSFELGEGPHAPIVEGQRVSPSFFRAMGVPPARGRAFTPEEGDTGAPTVVVSDGLWRHRFGGDPGLIGRTIALDGEPHTVIGIMPPGFGLVDLPDKDDLFLPFRFAADADEERGNNYDAIARLAPDATREAAEAELAVLTATFRRAYPDHADETESYLLTGYLAPYISDRLRTALWGFLGGAGFVLIIACMNVISLFLARAQVRRREFSVPATAIPWR
jgi:putative ABC transport system permease protein